MQRTEVSSDADTVSVVISSYRRPQFLAAAIESALAQSHPPFEIIVVDDASPEDVQGTLAGFGNCARVRYVRQARNMGPNAARNRGVALAKGRFVAFLDDDDVWLPRKIELQLIALKAQGAEACLCGYQVLDSPVVQVRNYDALHADEVMQTGAPAGFSSLLVKREVVEALGLDERLAWQEDWEFYARLVRRHPIAYVPCILYGYRQGAHQSLSSSLKSADIDALERRTATIRKHREWMGERVFRDRLADIYLAYVGSRRDPWKFLAHSLKNAGLTATMRAIARSLIRWFLLGLRAVVRRLGPARGLDH
jgi:glycosyltransferase involved in cell wall biosynthesis